MLKASFLSLPFLLLSINSHAIEPVLDQQAIFYFDFTFDTSQKTKYKHHFGLRLDHAWHTPGDNITVGQLLAKPAIISLRMNNHGLQALELNGIDYAHYDSIYHATEDSAKTNNGTETQPLPERVEQPKKKLEIPLGVIIGGLIGILAVASGL